MCEHSVHILPGPATNSNAPFCFSHAHFRNFLNPDVSYSSLKQILKIPFTYSIAI